MSKETPTRSKQEYVAEIVSGLTRLCRVDSSTSALWTGIFPVEGCLFTVYYQFYRNSCSVLIANSVDHDQTARSTVSDHSLHCLPTCPLWDARPLLRQGRVGGLDVRKTRSKSPHSFIVHYSRGSSFWFIPFLTKYCFCVAVHITTPLGYVPCVAFPGYLHFNFLPFKVNRLLGGHSTWI